MTGGEAIVIELNAPHEDLCFMAPLSDTAPTATEPLAGRDDEYTFPPELLEIAVHHG